MKKNTLAKVLSNTLAIRCRGSQAQVRRDNAEHAIDVCRRKDIKNPRVKNKMRFDKKSKARRGQVQDVREPSAAYGGESTGIKAGVSKSRRF